MVYILSVKVGFAAGHFIPFHPKCGNVHGHNYEVVAEFLVPKGVFVDFGLLKSILRDIAEELDHKFIAPREFREEMELISDYVAHIMSGELHGEAAMRFEVVYLDEATCESISKYFYERLEKRLSEIDSEAEVVRVRVWETPGFTASYGGERS